MNELASESSELNELASESSELNELVRDSSVRTGPPDRPATRPLPRPDQGIWPGLGTPPNRPGRARIAEALFRRAVRGLDVQVLLADGERLGAGGPDAPVMHVPRPAALFQRLGSHGNIGFGEAYMVGDWTTDTPADVLAPFAATLTTLIPPTLQRLRRWVVEHTPAEESNTIDGARENIHRHYDLSNELFAAFLDETMTYSSAYFEHPDEDLVTAQHRKIDSILDLAGVRAGQHVVEIGTGWGALAIRAARRGARVTSLTISAEQRALAEQRIGEAGVADRVQVLLRDYREARGSYDAVVSVEMIEAVGMDYWPTYFATLDRLLAPGGRIGLQSITMAHDRMMVTRRNYTWIHKYVFPGGLIPSLTAIEEQLAAHTGLRVARSIPLGPHYARTLARWRETFLARWDRVAALGFDETFRRMWEFYLAYCEAGFRVGYLDVHQLALERA